MVVTLGDLGGGNRPAEQSPRVSYLSSGPAPSLGCQTPWAGNGSVCSWADRVQVGIRMRRMRPAGTSDKESGATVAPTGKGKHKMSEHEPVRPLSGLRVVGAAAYLEIVSE